MRQHETHKDAQGTAPLKVAEVAEILRCQPRRIYAYIDAGSLRAEFIAGRWLVDPVDLANFRASTENVRRRRRRAA